MCIEPNNERATTNKQWYEQILEEQNHSPEGSTGTTQFVNKKNVLVSKDFANYERLCRGEQTRVRYFSLSLRIVTFY